MFVITKDLHEQSDQAPLLVQIIPGAVAEVFHLMALLPIF